MLAFYYLLMLLCLLNCLLVALLLAVANSLMLVVTVVPSLWLLLDPNAPFGSLYASG
jgi:hypothetical protein